MYIKTKAERFLAEDNFYFGDFVFMTKAGFLKEMLLRSLNQFFKETSRETSKHSALKNREGVKKCLIECLNQVNFRFKPSSSETTRAFAANLLVEMHQSFCFRLMQLKLAFWFCKYYQSKSEGRRAVTILNKAFLTNRLWLEHYVDILIKYKIMTKALLNLNSKMIEQFYEVTHENFGDFCSDLKIRNGMFNHFLDNCLEVMPIDTFKALLEAGVQANQNLGDYRMAALFNELRTKILMTYEVFRILMESKNQCETVYANVVLDSQIIGVLLDTIEMHIHQKEPFARIMSLVLQYLFIHYNMMESITSTDPTTFENLKYSSEFGEKFETRMFEKSVLVKYLSKIKSLSTRFKYLKENWFSEINRMKIDKLETEFILIKGYAQQTHFDETCRKFDISQTVKFMGVGYTYLGISEVGYLDHFYYSKSSPDIAMTAIPKVKETMRNNFIDNYFGSTSQEDVFFYGQVYSYNLYFSKHASIQNWTVQKTNFVKKSTICQNQENKQNLRNLLIAFKNEINSSMCLANAYERTVVQIFRHCIEKVRKADFAPETLFFRKRTMNLKNKNKPKAEILKNKILHRVKIEDKKKRIYFHLNTFDSSNFKNERNAKSHFYSEFRSEIKCVRKKYALDDFAMSFASNCNDQVVLRSNSNNKQKTDSLRHTNFYNHKNNFEDSKIQKKQKFKEKKQNQTKEILMNRECQFLLIDEAIDFILPEITFTIFNDFVEKGSKFEFSFHLKNNQMTVELALSREFGWHKKTVRSIKVAGTKELLDSIYNTKVNKKNRFNTIYPFLYALFFERIIENGTDWLQNKHHKTMKQFNLSFDPICCNYLKPTENGSNKSYFNRFTIYDFQCYKNFRRLLLFLGKVFQMLSQFQNTGFVEFVKNVDFFDFPQNAIKLDMLDVFLESWKRHRNLVELTAKKLKLKFLHKHRLNPEISEFCSPKVSFCDTVASFLLSQIRSFFKLAVFNSCFPNYSQTEQQWSTQFTHRIKLHDRFLTLVVKYKCEMSKIVANQHSLIDIFEAQIDFRKDLKQLLLTVLFVFSKLFKLKVEIQTDSDKIRQLIQKNKKSVELNNSKDDLIIFKKEYCQLRGCQDYKFDILDFLACRRSKVLENSDEFSKASFSDLNFLVKLTCDLVTSPSLFFKNNDQILNLVSSIESEIECIQSATYYSISGTNLIENPKINHFEKFIFNSKSFEKITNLKISLKKMIFCYSRLAKNEFDSSQVKRICKQNRIIDYIEELLEEKTQLGLFFENDKFESGKKQQSSSKNASQNLKIEIISNFERIKVEAINHLEKLKYLKQLEEENSKTNATFVLKNAHSMKAVYHSKGINKQVLGYWNSKVVSNSMQTLKKKDSRKFFSLNQFQHACENECEYKKLFLIDHE